MKYLASTGMVVSHASSAVAQDTNNVEYKSRLVSMGQRVSRLCKDVVHLDEVKFTHERLLEEKVHHMQDLQRDKQYLYICLSVIAVVSTLIILCLSVLTFYLLGLRDEQKRRLEAQRYEAIILEHQNRIKELEAIKATKQESQHQQLVYALPGLPGNQH